MIKKEGKSQVIKVVYLQYGSLAEIISKKFRKENLFSKEEVYVSQGTYFQSLLSEIRNQGDVFLSPSDYLQGGHEYWNEEVKHLAINYQKANNSKIGIDFCWKKQITV